MNLEDAGGTQRTSRSSSRRRAPRRGEERGGGGSGSGEEELKSRLGVLRGSRGLREETKAGLALGGHRHCPGWVTWLGQPHQSPLVSNNNRLISSTETKCFPLSPELAPSPRTARQGRLKQRARSGIPGPREAGEQPPGYIFNLTMAPRK